MNNKKNFRILALLLLIVSACGVEQSEKNTKTTITSLAPTPPLGYNSYQSYQTYMHETEAIKTIDVMAEKYLPFGYNYFVIDDGWQVEAELFEGTTYPKKEIGVALDEFGLLEPSKTYFPNGMAAIADYAHQKGLKFGLWIIRGIPRIAVEQNLPIKGTNYHARDIADTTSVCSWKEQNFGIDMSKPGAQEYYNALIDKLASWGVDFIKADDIAPYPKEIMAVVHAIENGGHKIALSLSPGNNRNQYESFLPYFKKTTMHRISGDFWDNQPSIDVGFRVWKVCTGFEGKGTWMDLDMVPFGRLRINSPDSTIVPDMPEKYRSRVSLLSNDQMKTYITQRALAASPIFIGGDLLTMDDYSYSLLTNKDMLACNQNGVMGLNTFSTDTLDIFLSFDNESPTKGWFGVFNRKKFDVKVTLTKKDIGLIEYDKNYGAIENHNDFKLKDIWEGKEYKMGGAHEFTIPANGVVFMQFSEITD
ncbi:glycoside hydrolase family 27 protein [Maribellus sediminis]|uniref:glycoside hydrolase family 27 protein n=1 Tax=Maribellus sediminis TaxID=2696285 RepID=UPI0014318302|nr:glycoside hydrolase family 27 protein [Maribellus sediminis]